jgi:hypothetical protein
LGNARADGNAYTISKEDEATQKARQQLRKNVLKWDERKLELHAKKISDGIKATPAAKGGAPAPSRLLSSERILGTPTRSECHAVELTLLWL